MLPLFLAAGLSVGDVPKDVDYLRDVKPILAARCFACHGAIKQKGDLRVDTAAALREGGNKGPAIIPGDSRKSLLLERILGKGGLKRMPPEDAGEALKPAEVERITRWIDQGAIAPTDERPETDPADHWAFKVPVRPPVPKVKNAAWAGNPIDAFLAQKHDERGLSPQPSVEKSLLLRRVTLDLIGLPPTAAELDAFQKDAAPDAYEKVVDRLLASPHYGERWGRHWMDVWRYSDWWGLGQELRNSQKHIWHWRDWIVESLNQDKGYDRMVREMLAADELYPTDDSALRGTGFLARHYFKFNRTTWLDETIEHTSKAFLGLTMNCSKCHDHKYDPLTQVDYYRLRAFFEPYQIRTDMVPGEASFEKNGIPRAFDCNLTAPTFLHIRGNESQPDKERKITPGLPSLLAPKGLEIREVKLPPEAYQPGLRPFVLKTHLTAAEKQLKESQHALQKAREQLAKAETGKEEPVKEGQSLAEAKSAALIAEKRIAAAEALIRSLHARAAADRARIADPEEATSTSRAAALSEKQLALTQAELALAEAEHNRLRPKEKTDPAALLKKAQANLQAARKALAAPGEAYTPLVGALKTLESNLESEESRRKPFPTVSTGRRSALAQWIASDKNPLTARVAVNHIWMRHFGEPLVATVFDFGRKGAMPSHPELLDWLACELMSPSVLPDAKERHAWSMKHLHRLMVTSNAYRMTTSRAGAAAANQEKDPDNHYLWRMNPQRMESQVVRDSLLHLAGQLDLTLGGPTVDPPQQDASRRRSLYFFHSAIERNRFLTAFDEADPLDCYRRRESVVPQQALALSNSKLALAVAEKIAGSVEKRLGKASDEDFASEAFRLVLAVAPGEEELAACTRALSRWRELHAKDDGRRARSLLVHALLNHNDFVTVR